MNKNDSLIRLETPADYAVNERETEEFDRMFPPKQKQKLPGQLE